MIHIKQGLLFTLAGILFTQIFFLFLNWINKEDKKVISNDQTGENTDMMTVNISNDELVTNGDVIKSIFPDGEIVPAPTNDTEIAFQPKDSWVIWFSKIWWNTPYKSREENK